MTTIRLIEDAYLAGSHKRMPTRDGKPSVYVLEESWYQAAAVDDDGNRYQVYWDIKDEDAEDESNACDWDTPAYIVDENGCEASDRVTF